MKVVLLTDSSNGISLFVTPETDGERALLKGLWKHGHMTTCNGAADNSSQGFCVQWKFDESRREQETTDG